MSRSYKKHPWVTDHNANTTQEKKKFANKKVRNTEDLPNGSAYKKVSESYDICDWKHFQSKEEMLEEYEKNKDDPWFQKLYPTLKHWIRYWRKIYFNK